MLFVLAIMQVERQSDLLFPETAQSSNLSVCGLVLNINNINGEAEPF